MSDNFEFFIPLRGRLVTGSVHETRKKDHENKPVPYENQGYEFGIAYPKAEFKAWADATLWPHWSQEIANAPGGLDRLTQFWTQFGAKGILSTKIIDGDIPTGRDQKVNENTAGHYVIYLSTYGGGDEARQPAVVAGPTADRLVEIDISQLKRGDYVTFDGSSKFNAKSGNQMGFYMNCYSIWKLEDGPVISGGGDPTAGFAGATLTGTYDPSNGAAAGYGAAPAGNSVAAPAPTGPAGSPAPVGAPSTAPAPTASHGEQQQQGAYYGAMQPAGAPAPQAAAGAPPLPPGVAPAPQG